MTVATDATRSWRTPIGQAPDEATQTIGVRRGNFRRKTHGSQDHVSHAAFCLAPIEPHPTSAPEALMAIAPAVNRHDDSPTHLLKPDARDTSCEQHIPDIHAPTRTFFGLKARDLTA